MSLTPTAATPLAELCDQASEMAYVAFQGGGIPPQDVGPMLVQLVERCRLIPEMIDREERLDAENERLDNRVGRMEKRIEAAIDALSCHYRDELEGPSHRDNVMTLAGVVGWLRDTL